MYLSSFSIVEPEDRFYFYRPSWLNTWEAHCYLQALKASHANGWGLKRFGTQAERYAEEMIRNPQYLKYLEAMEQSADEALQALPAKERMKLFKQRTAFIYVDSWGESGPFENINSALHISAIDTLPRNLVKKFAVTAPTCKIRGEKQSFVQAINLAKDYLSWDIFDYVVICGAYRAIPVLTFSDEENRLTYSKKRRERADSVHLTVERTACFIFNRREGALKVSGGHYVKADSIQDATDVGRIAFAGTNNTLLQRSIGSVKNALNLAATYGASGCLTPALSFAWINQHSSGSGKIRTVVPDKVVGYSYFDVEEFKE